ncbi:D-ribitol-5-phosphate cytidylyltransferase-like [Centruroides sculpturatus]|uniref:D-ribitol-5-phosphate cytidylyltransferase-like n=1 Tax=Centruroides sculpturatus TaxID=218467 RepID=UPI000C6D5912|nr:D-ribitol-5-phosphate cytidylyltransferase-like [Centruroides sculpturatus]
MWTTRFQGTNNAIYRQKWKCGQLNDIIENIKPSLMSKSKNVNFKVGVVLPAAGSGERFGSDIPKQYCHVLHRPIILHAIDTFLRQPWIHKIVIVSSELEQMYKYLSEYSPENFKKLHVTIGSSTRHKSIYCGLQALEKIDKSIEVVIIHDGVRPVIPETILEEVVMAAKTYGAAGVIRPLVSTVISQDKEKLLDVVLDRTKYYASEMPQAFTFNMILDAYSKQYNAHLHTGRFSQVHLPYCHTSLSEICHPSIICETRWTHQL